MKLGRLYAPFAGLIKGSSSLSRFIGGLALADTFDEDG